MANSTDLHFVYSILSTSDHSSWSPLVPQQLITTTIQDLALLSRTSGADYSRDAWKGFHCENCGRLSSRTQWTRLVCPTTGCSRVELQPLVHSAKQLGVSESSWRNRSPPKYGSSIAALEINVKGFRGWTLQLPDKRGKIHQLWPDDLGSSDSLLEDYQRGTAQLFHRNRLGVHPRAFLRLSSMLDASSVEIASDFNHCSWRSTWTNVDESIHIQLWPSLLAHDQGSYRPLVHISPTCPCSSDNTHFRLPKNYYKANGGVVQ